MVDISEGIQFRRDGVDPNQWPKLSCSEANQLALEVSNLRLDAQREILFQGNGQLTASGDMLFLTAGSSPEKLRILANGNVGIGKSDPEAKLEVNGDLKLQQGVAVNEFSSDGNLTNNNDVSVPTQKAVKTYVDAQITQVNQTLSTKAALAGASSQDFQTKNLTVSGNLTTTGNVGIGTTNPKEKLDVAGNINTTGIISGASLPPNLIRNSYMNILDGTKPAGYSVLGNVTLEAAHPYTKGFEGPYWQKPASPASSVDTATEANPYYFGEYNKGPRASRGGLADGWHSFSDGRILKITGNNSGEHTSVFFPFEQNVLTNKVHFKAWLKIASGGKVGFGADSGYVNVVRGLIITKQQTDAAPDGWYQIDAVIDISEMTSLDNLSFSMGIEASGTFEVYLALPYLANLDNDTWLPSVSDMLSRDGLTVHPSSRNVGIGTTSPYTQLTLTGSIGFTNATTPMMYIFQSGVANPERPIIAHSPPYSNWGLSYRDNDDTMIFKGAGTAVMAVNLGGQTVGIGTASPSYKLDVAGAAHASSFPTSSDVRLKTNITSLTKVLEKLEKIRGVSFEWNELYESLGRSTGHREIGVMAQEVEAQFPELVTTWGDEGYKAVDYGRLTGVLIEAAKELRAENESLKQRIEALEQAIKKK